MPKPISEQLQESMESMRILEHLHRKMYHAEWDGQDRQWIVGFLIAEHGLRLREANGLAHPASGIVLGEMLRKLRADRKVDPFAERRLSDRDHRIVELGEKGLLPKDIKPVIDDEFPDETIGLRQISNILEKNGVHPPRRGRPPKRGIAH